MDSKGVQTTYQVLLPWVDHGSVAKLFDRDEDADSVTHFLDSHLLQNLLVAVDQVVSIEVVGCDCISLCPFQTGWARQLTSEDRLILATLDTMKPRDHLFLIPRPAKSQLTWPIVPCSMPSISPNRRELILAVRKVRLGRARKPRTILHLCSRRGTLQVRVEGRRGGLVG